MGRAMLIMCAGALIALGYFSISTSKQGKMLTEKTVNYADFVMAKNAAHTAIQMSMQNINKDDTWADTHNQNNPWKTNINEREVELYTEYNPSANFWDPDELRLISNAKHNEISVRVISQYLMEPFSSLVPDFAGALQLPTEIGTFNVDGAAHAINGTPPSAHNCPESKPPIMVNSDITKQKVEDAGTNVDGEVVIDPSLNYEPTDELIERLNNSGNAITVNSEYSQQLGSADNPGVFFIEGSVKLTGKQSQGFGIMVIRSGGNMVYEGDDGTELSVAGNFEFNGLIIFENAYDFDGRGTPTINGSVLVGSTPDYEGSPINIDLGGDININYDCQGEDYARKAAAMAVQQYKYTRVVTSEGVNYNL